MVKLISGISLIFLLIISGCASSLEEVNKGAEESGKPAGKVLRVPNSFSKGVAEGIAGEPESNPYDR